MTLIAIASSASFNLIAQAAGGGASGAGGLLVNPMVFMVLMFVMMYFVLIRPQRQRQKAHEELVKSVKTGDHIVTAGGVHGIVASVKDTTLMLRVADNVRVEYDRSAVATVKKKTEGDASASIADKS